LSRLSTCQNGVKLIKNSPKQIWTVNIKLICCLFQISQGQSSSPLWKSNVRAQIFDASEVEDNMNED